MLAADLASADSAWAGAQTWTLAQVKAAVAAAPMRLEAIAADRLALSAAHVAAVRFIAAELMPALTALQRQAEQHALVAPTARASAAAALAASLDATAQIIRNTLSLLKELPLGAADGAAVDRLLWGMALHAQIRCVRAHAALPADGHALAVLAGALQLLAATLCRHGFASAAALTGVAGELGSKPLAAYAGREQADGVALGLLVLRDGYQAVRWLQAAVTEGSHAAVP